MPAETIQGPETAARGAAARPAPAASLQKRETAEEFEAVFLAEMLSQAGLEKALAADSGFGGEAMSGLLVQELAEKIVDRGGFGLADRILRQMKDRLENDQ